MRMHPDQTNKRLKQYQSEVDRNHDRALNGKAFCRNGHAEMTTPNGIDEKERERRIIEYRERASQAQEIFTGKPYGPYEDLPVSRKIIKDEVRGLERYLRNNTHGHVFAHRDVEIARCGGPLTCEQCKLEKRVSEFIEAMRIAAGLAHGNTNGHKKAL